MYIENDVSEPVWLSSAPVMLFIDELDVLCGSGNKEKVSDQEKRVSATLRSLIDGFSSSKSTGHPPTSNGRVVLVAATNRPSAIDPSFRRPGKMRDPLFRSNQSHVQPLQKSALHNSCISINRST